MKKLSILIMLSAIISCPKENTNLVSVPLPVKTDMEWCRKAEENLKNLKCIPVNEPYTKKGLTFTQFCIKEQNNGIFLNPKCLAIQVTQKTGCGYMDVCTGSK